MHAKRIFAASTKAVEAIRKLRPQLSDRPLQPDRALKRIIENEANIFIVAEHDSKFVGMLLVHCWDSFTGRMAKMNDVVVDIDHRRQGAARMMVMEALAHAKHLGVRQLDLTSGDHRPGAHAVYLDCGFERVDETNVFRYTFP